MFLSAPSSTPASVHFAGFFANFEPAFESTLDTTLDSTPFVVPKLSSPIPIRSSTLLPEATATVIWVGVHGPS